MLLKSGEDEECQVVVLGDSEADVYTQMYRDSIMVEIRLRREE